MTPKEKAIELIKKMDVIHYIKLGGINKNSKGLPVSMYNDQIKQCALNAADELILSHSQDTTDNQFYHWQEVKQEIEKL